MVVFLQKDYNRQEISLQDVLELPHCIESRLAPQIKGTLLQMVSGKCIRINNCLPKLSRGRKGFGLGVGQVLLLLLYSFNVLVHLAIAFTYIVTARRRPMRDSLTDLCLSFAVS